MSTDEMNQLADLWIAGWEIEIKSQRRAEEADAIERVSNMHLDGEHAELWKFILAVYSKPMTDRVFAVLAAGPLEDLLSDFGPHYVDRVEELARQVPRFNDLLGGVWRNSISSDVWDRIERVRNNVW